MYLIEIFLGFILKRWPMVFSCKHLLGLGDSLFFLALEYLFPEEWIHGEILLDLILQGKNSSIWLARKPVDAGWLKTLFFLTECSSENGKCNKAEIRGITFSLLLSITIIFLLEAALLKYSLIYFVEELIQAKMTGTPSQWLSRGGVSHWWKGNQPFSLSGTVWWLRTGVTATAVGFLRDCRPVSSPVLLRRVFMAAELNCGSPHVATSWSL